MSECRETSASATAFVITTGLSV